MIICGIVLLMFGQWMRIRLLLLGVIEMKIIDILDLVLEFSIFAESIDDVEQNIESSYAVGNRNKNRINFYGNKFYLYDYPGSFWSPESNIILARRHGTWHPYPNPSR